MFLSIQFDLQALLNEKNRISRKRYAGEVIEDYLSNSLFPCSKILSDALLYITGEEYEVNGCKTRIPHKKHDQKKSIYKYLENGDIPKQEYNRILRLCPLERKSEDALPRLKSNACIVQFFDRVDVSIATNSPTQLIETTIKGISTCPKIDKTGSIQKKYKSVDRYSAQDFCDWFDLFSRRIHEVNLE